MYSGKISKKTILVVSTILMSVLVVIDQLSKYLVVINRNTLHSNPIELLPGFFNLVYVRNTGAAWGMFHGNNLILLIIAVAALILFSIFFKAITENYPERVVGFFMVISGIIGNSIDRIVRGSVVDFLDFYYKSYHWPSFNVADSAICVGVIIIIISSLLRKAKVAESTNEE